MSTSNQFAALDSDYEGDGSSEDNDLPEVTPISALANKKTRFTGLLNQGATCYLNSLLQMFYMTPEIRSGMFSLTKAELDPQNATMYDEKQGESPSKAAKSGDEYLKIPYALIELFVHMQTGFAVDQLFDPGMLITRAKAVSTKDLTKAFGWENQEERVQQDISELYRLFIRVLEKKLKSTNVRSLYSIFKGKYATQTQCRTCKYANPNPEPFMDVILPVEGHSSLEDSLAAYFATEEMTGSSQYRCPSCNEKRDADRSLQLTQLPQMFTFSLNRFRFDWNRNVREKINTAFVFPPELDMKRFVRDNEVVFGQSYLYELNCVIVHRGGANSGHYYAYIRDLMDEVPWQLSGKAKKGNKSYAQKVQDAQKAADKPDKQPKGPVAKEAYSILQQMCLMAVDSGCKIRVDDIGQKFIDLTGKSWKKNYRRECGPMTSFVAKFPKTFELLHRGTVLKLIDENAQEIDEMEKEAEAEEAKKAEEEKKAAEAKAAEEKINAEQEKKKVEEAPKPIPRIEPKWFKFNDSDVTPSSADQAMSHVGGGKSTESAYILIYRRREITTPSVADTEASTNDDAKTERSDAEETAQSERKETTDSSSSVDARTKTISTSKSRSSSRSRSPRGRKNRPPKPDALPTWVLEGVRDKQVLEAKQKIALTVNAALLTADSKDSSKNKHSLVTWMATIPATKTMPAKEFMDLLQAKLVAHAPVFADASTRLEINRVAKHGPVEVMQELAVDGMTLEDMLGVNVSEVELLLEQNVVGNPEAGGLAAQELKRRKQYCLQTLVTLVADDESKEEYMMYFPNAATVADVKLRVHAFHKAMRSSEDAKERKSVAMGRFYNTLRLIDLERHPNGNLLTVRKFWDAEKENKTMSTVFSGRKLNDVRLTYDCTPAPPENSIYLQYYVAANGFPTADNASENLEGLVVDPKMNVREFRERLIRQLVANDLQTYPGPVGDLLEEKVNALMPTSLLGRVGARAEEALFRDESKTLADYAVVEDDVLLLETTNLRPANVVTFQVYLRKNEDLDSPFFHTDPLCACDTKEEGDEKESAPESKDGNGCPQCGLPLSPYRFQRNALKPVETTIDVHHDTTVGKLRALIEGLPGVKEQLNAKVKKSVHGTLLGARMSFLDLELQPFYILKDYSADVRSVLKSRRKRHPQLRHITTSTVEDYVVPLPMFIQIVESEPESKAWKEDRSLLAFVSLRHSLVKVDEESMIAWAGENTPPQEIMLRREGVRDVNDLKAQLLPLFPVFEGEALFMEIAIYNKKFFTWELLPQKVPQKQSKKKRKQQKKRNRYLKKVSTAHLTWTVITQMSDFDVLVVRDVRLDKRSEKTKMDELTKAQIKEVQESKYLTEFDNYMRLHAAHPHFNVADSGFRTGGSSASGGAKKGAEAPGLFIDGAEFTSSEDDDDDYESDE